MDEEEERKNNMPLGYLAGYEAGVKVGVNPSVVRIAFEAMHLRIRALEQMIEVDYMGLLDDAPPSEEAIAVLMAAVEAAEEAASSRESI